MDHPLELDTRRRIYEHLQRFPGAHMREIGREVDIPMGTLEYHLHYLVKADLLTIRQDGRFTRYFATGELSRREKDILAVLRQKIPRQIAAHLLLEPNSSHGQILTRFDVSPSTLTFHIKKLLRNDIVEQEKVGRENRYRVLEPELVARVLIAHKESFFDDVIDRFADVWLALEPQDGDDVADDGPPGMGGGVLMVLAALPLATFRAVRRELQARGMAPSCA